MKSLKKETVVSTAYYCPKCGNRDNDLSDIRWDDSIEHGTCSECAKDFCSTCYQSYDSTFDSKIDPCADLCRKCYYYGNGLI